MSPKYFLCKKCFSGKVKTRELDTQKYPPKNVEDNVFYFRDLDIKSRKFTVTHHSTLFCHWAESNQVHILSKLN